jgi:hypothetical protein
LLRVSVTVSSVLVLVDCRIAASNNRPAVTSLGNALVGEAEAVKLADVALPEGVRNASVSDTAAD